MKWDKDARETILQFYIVLSKTTEFSQLLNKWIKSVCAFTNHLVVE